MSTETKISPVSILVTLGLVTVVIFGVLPALKRTVTNDDAPVTITITFSPSPRSGLVPPNRTLKDVITVEIEMKPEQTREFVTESGWTTVRTPAKGQKVDGNKNTGARPAICAFTPH